MLDEALRTASPVISTYEPRTEAHIYTDKVIYRPNDVMFIEVYVDNAFNKTPINLNASLGSFNGPYLSLEILDPSGATIFSDSAQVYNSTASFIYKLPSDPAGGEYLIRASNYQIPYAFRLVRVRNYPRDKLVITIQLNADSYRPGDLITG